jgi:hypothetical protein
MRTNTVLVFLCGFLFRVMQDTHPGFRALDVGIKCVFLEVEYECEDPRHAPREE